MAGMDIDTGAFPAPVIPEPSAYYSDGERQHKDVLAALEAIREAIVGSVATGSRFDLPYSGHLQLLAEYIVISVSLACQVTLTFGTTARIFDFPAGDTRVIPFPEVLPRGQNVSITASGGAVIDQAYIIAKGT